MATELYTKQYGMTPEEHRAKLDSDLYLWDFSKPLKLKFDERTKLKINPIHMSCKTPDS